jgi:hypothetical protein
MYLERLDTSISYKIGYVDILKDRICRFYEIRYCQDIESSLICRFYEIRYCEDIESSFTKISYTVSII